MVFIPQGTTHIGNANITFDPFWMSACEVTNGQYNEFLQDQLKASTDSSLYLKFRVQNENWSANSYWEPYKTYYHQHPAYEHYPVVNITREAAVAYAAWLTEKEGSTDAPYRLPTRNEFIYAAKGGFDNGFYPWGGTRLMDDKGKFRCNFREIGDEQIHSVAPNEFEIIPTARQIENPVIATVVDSFDPNQYGLYNMSGNVAEMVADADIAMGGSWNSTGYDVRVDSEQPFTNASPYVGFRLVKDYFVSRAK